MTDPEILKLAETCGFDMFQKRKYDGESDYGAYWECWEDHLLLFAKVVYEEGYDQGCYDDSKSSSFKGFHTCLDD